MFPKERVQTLSVTISQDGAHRGVAQEAASFIANAKAFGIEATHMQHTQSRLPGDTGYHKLARHFKWAFEQMFAGGMTAAAPQQVIILEDDILIAPDFFQYFLGLIPILRADPTLWTIRWVRVCGARVWRACVRAGLCGPLPCQSSSGAHSRWRRTAACIRAPPARPTAP